MAEYGNRPTLDKLEPHYSRHVSAMTTEGLWSKSDIAAELAVRDARLEAAQRRVAALEKEASGLVSALHSQSSGALSVVARFKLSDLEAALAGRKSDVKATE